MDQKDLKIEDLEKYVRDTDLVLVMMTRNYLSSKNCLRELGAAYKYSYALGTGRGDTEARDGASHMSSRRRLLFVLETDYNHGAVTFEEASAEVARSTKDDIPQAKELVLNLLENGAGSNDNCIEFYRERHLKLELLRDIAERILQMQYHSIGVQIREKPIQRCTIFLSAHLEAVDTRAAERLRKAFKEGGDDNVDVSSSDKEKPMIVFLSKALFERDDNETGRGLLHLKEVQAYLQEVIDRLEKVKKKQMSADTIIPLYCMEWPNFDHYFKHFPRKDDLAEIPAARDADSQMTAKLWTLRQRLVQLGLLDRLESGLAPKGCSEWRPRLHCWLFRRTPHATTTVARRACSTASAGAGRRAGRRLQVNGRRR